MNEHSFIFAPIIMRTRDEHKIGTIRKKAIEMIVNEGFDGLSMQKLAKAADVSPATIYIYFKDRDDLILQLFIEESAKMAEATLKNFDPEMSFEEGLRVQWFNRVKYCLKYPQQAHFMEQIRFSPFHDIAFKNMNTSFITVMSTFVHNAIKRKELVKLPIEVYWSMAFAPLYQLLKFHMSGRGMLYGGKFTLDEKVMEQTLKLVIKALQP